MTSLLGASPAIVAIREEVEYLKRSDAKVLISGESGVGKEVLARTIHASSRRGRAKLVSVNCAGVAESLLESELFGHAKGSFTGALRDKPGLLEVANRGTIFLDEIGEMSLRMQAVLLRFLESGEIQPVGSVAPLERVDVRVISATNRNLADEIESGGFRGDLYYRLNVVHLKIPPLRERRDDIAPLVEHFLRMLSQQQECEAPEIPTAVMDLLLEYRWPGNVRELRNVIDRLVVRRPGEIVRPEDLPESFTGERVSGRLGSTGEPTYSASVAEQLYDRMLKTGESFWSVVYPAFISRDLTRDTIRELVIRGLRQTRGSYKILVPLFNMKDTDYRRFLTFLRKYDLHQPFHAFRTPFAGGAGDPSRARKRAWGRSASDQKTRLA